MVRRLVPFDAAAEFGEADLIFDAPGVEAVGSRCAGVVLETGNKIRAATLLEAGAPIVLVGEAALHDSGVVERLIAAHGGERVGIYAPARRQTVSWSIEVDSNADFKTIAPSICEPAWEVLTADGAGSGTLLHWWLAALRDLGATQFLVRADVDDDVDLNICAGLVENFDDRLWLGPLADTTPRLDEWITYGQCRQLALLPDLFARMGATKTEGTSSCAT